MLWRQFTTGHRQRRGASAGGAGWLEG